VWSLRSCPPAAERAEKPTVFRFPESSFLPTEKEPEPDAAPSASGGEEEGAGCERSPKSGVGASLGERFGRFARGIRDNSASTEPRPLATDERNEELRLNRSPKNGPDRG
jgi:hypothetical protein